jgi:hypothetical protein
MADVLCVAGQISGKPAPDPYLAAACRLGLDDAPCIAFEFAVNGVGSGLLPGYLPEPHSAEICGTLCWVTTARAA